MFNPKGKIVLMGSGEFTGTMVEVHKQLLAGISGPPMAYFLDTPAGFQLNADEISRKAVDYFRTHVQKPLSVLSFKDRDTVEAYAAEQTFRRLREADFLLMGPGSPTYTVRQLENTPIPEIITERIQAGASLVAASAAALTVGRFTLPVYEIYKVGQALHWVDGLDILSHFGFNLAVVPHWNNAEGGTHDTRYCYMGKPRFDQLAAILPAEVRLLGIDEHTACIIDLESQQVEIRGLGGVTLGHQGRERRFEKGDRLSCRLLRDGSVQADGFGSGTPVEIQGGVPDIPEADMWRQIHALERAFHAGIARHDAGQATRAVLELDSTLWKALKNLESEENISQVREMLREWVVVLGNTLSALPPSREACLSPLVVSLIDLRTLFRKEKKWAEADRIRDLLHAAGITLADTPEGVHWRIKDPPA